MRCLRRVLGQFHYKRGPFAWSAVDPDLAMMVAYHRLHNGQSESGAVLLAGVVGREQALAFFFGESDARIFYLNAHSRLLVARSQCQCSMFLDGIQRIQD